MADSNVFDFPTPAARAAPAGRRLIPARLLDARKALRLTQEQLGSRVGVTRQSIAAYEAGDKTPEAETFAALAAELKQPIAFFTAADRPVFGEYSPRFFRKVGPDTARRNDACAVLGHWFVQAACYLDELVNYPPVHIPEVQRPLDSSGRYTAEEIETAAEQCRQQWGLGWGPISNVLALLESKGIAACRYPIEDERIDAFSFWSGDRPFIFMASEKEAGVRIRFDLAHELGHLVLHRWIEAAEIADPKTLKVIESEADRFAGAFLLPRKSFPNDVYSARLDAFLDLKRRWIVSIQAMIYRCRDLEVIDDTQFTNLYKQISFRKWRSKEPLDTPEEIKLEMPRLLGRAAQLVLESGRKHPDDLCTDLQLSPHLIEAFLNLPSGRLSVPPPTEFTPTLK
ncbi:XRE family transcriptional regulator [soil metagenome]